MARRSGSALERLVRPRPQDCWRTGLGNLRGVCCGKNWPDNLRSQRERAAAPLRSDARRCLPRRPNGLTEQPWLGRRRLPRCATESPSLVCGELVPRRRNDDSLSRSRVFTRELRRLRRLVAVRFTPKALTLLACHLICPARPNVRANRTAAVGRLGPVWENVPRTPSRAKTARRSGSGGSARG